MIQRCSVQISRFAEKQIQRLPKPILENLKVWTQTIEIQGIAAMRKLPGYHDEPLKGQRAGQRSSRLNRSYRVIYEEESSETLTIISILEVNKHEY